MATLHGGAYDDHPDNGNHYGEYKNASDLIAHQASTDSGLFGNSAHSTLADSAVHGAHGHSSDIVDAHHGADVSVGTESFVFSGGGGQNVVMNLADHASVVQIASNINGLDIQSAADVASRVSEVNGKAVVDLGHGDTLTLHGVTADEIHHDPGSFFTVH